MCTKTQPFISDNEGSLQFNQFLAVCETMRSRFPLTEQHLTHLKDMFNKYDADDNGRLDLEEMKVMLKDIDKKLTNLPAVSPSFYFISYPY